MKDSKDTTARFRIPTQLWLRLQEVAKREGISASKLLRRLVREFLD